MAPADFRTAREWEIERAERYIEAFYGNIQTIARNSLWFNGVLVGAAGYAAFTLIDNLGCKPELKPALFIVVFALAVIGVVFNLGSLGLLRRFFRLITAATSRLAELDHEPDSLGRGIARELKSSVLGLRWFSPVPLTNVFYTFMVVIWLAFPFVVWHVTPSTATPSTSALITPSARTRR